MPLQKLPLVAALLMAAFAVPAGAQQPPVKAVMDKVIADACPEFIQGLTGNPAFGAALAARPLNQPAICACIGTGMDQDAKFQRLMQGDQAAMAQRMAAPQFKNYVVARIAMTALRCISPELETSIEAMPLDAVPNPPR